MIYFLSLLVAMLDATILLVLLNLAFIFVTHKWPHPKIPADSFGEHELDGIKAAPLVDLTIRLTVIFIVPTCLVHSLVYLFVGTYLPMTAVRYATLFFMFVFQVGGVAALSHFLLKPKQLGLLIVTGLTAVAYPIILWAFLYYYLRP